MCELTRCCILFTKMKALLFKDPKQPPDFGGSKIDISLLQRSWAHFHMGTKRWALHSFGYPHPQTQDHHMGESSRRVNFSALLNPTEDPCEETFRNTFLVCSVPHIALCQGSPLQPRNWAEQSGGNRVYQQFPKPWSNQSGPGSI